MPLSQSLFNDLVPPAVWVTIGTLEKPEHDHVTLTLRVREAGRRSITASVPVTRYAPTSSIMLACSRVITRLELSQSPLDKALLGEELASAVRTWVDPF
jgi:hypothetical protein